MRYPVKLTPDGKYLMVSFPDIPEALTQGDSKEDALAHAVDALETALDFYFDDGRSIPLPSQPKRGQALVELPPTVAVKVMLHNEMVAQKIRPAELARRLKIPRQNVNRLLNRRHASSIDSMAAALSALGKRLELNLS